MYSFLAGVLIAVCATFMAFILWQGRSDRLPAAAYWSFSLFSVFIGLLLVLHETGLPLPQGWILSDYDAATRKQVTDDNAKILQELSDIKQKVLTKPPPPWMLIGEGSDCPANDVGRPTDGQTPNDDRCGSDNVHTAICWDGQIYKNANRPGAWCTYKSTPASSCLGGTNPGRMYSCSAKS